MYYTHYTLIDNCRSSGWFIFTIFTIHFFKNFFFNPSIRFLYFLLPSYLIRAFSGDCRRNFDDRKRRRHPRKVGSWFLIIVSIFLYCTYQESFSRSCKTAALAVIRKKYYFLVSIVYVARWRWFKGILLPGEFTTSTKYWNIFRHCSCIVHSWFFPALNGGQSKWSSIILMFLRYNWIFSSNYARETRRVSFLFKFTITYGLLLWDTSCYWEIQFLFTDIS